MTPTAPDDFPAVAGLQSLTAAAVAAAPFADVLGLLDTSADGLSSSEAATRLARFGPNSLRTHRVSAWAVLRRQLNNAVLALLGATAVVSFFLGDSTQASIIGVILVVSVGLGSNGLVGGNGPLKSGPSELLVRTAR